MKMVSIQSMTVAKGDRNAPDPSLSRDPMSPDAEFTVQQAAKLTGLSEHTLRYYERAGLIQPVHRHHSSGHRRYSGADITKLQTLACLRAAGMSLNRMRQYEELLLQGDAAASRQQALFEEQQRILRKQMEQLQWNLQYVELKIAYWRAVEAGDTEKAADIRREIDTQTRAYARR